MPLLLAMAFQLGGTSAYQLFSGRAYSLVSASCGQFYNHWVVMVPLMVSPGEAVEWPLGETMSREKCLEMDMKFGGEKVHLEKRAPVELILLLRCLHDSDVSGCSHVHCHFTGGIQWLIFLRQILTLLGGDVSMTAGTEGPEPTLQDLLAVVI